MTNKNKVPKQVLVDSEEKMSLDQAATFIQTIAEKLKSEQSFTLTHAGQTHEVRPSSQVELEVKLEKKGDKNKFELEIEWRDGGDSTIEIG